MTTHTKGQNKGKLKTYFKGVRSELKKVAWPSRKELINYTGIVLLLSTIVAIIVYILDILLNNILGLFI